MTNPSEFTDKVKSQDLTSFLSLMRRFLDAMDTPQKIMNLARSPGRMPATLGYYQPLYFLVGCMQAGAGTAASFLQSRTALIIMAAKILVTRLATDPKISTQISDRETARSGQRYKAFFFGHYIGLFPWHKCHYRVLPMSLCYTKVVLPLVRKLKGNTSEG